MDWFKKHYLLQDRNVSHTSAAVIFSGPAIGKPSLSGNVAPWFHTTDMTHCASLLADLASPKLTIYKSDIDAIIRVLGVRSIKEDYGQANRDTTQPVISVAYNHAITATENSAVAEAPIKSASPAKKEPTQTLNIPSVEKKSVSGMFKTAVAVGGLFLTMAIVSQIYPTAGQSSTLTSEQAQPSVPPMQLRAQAVYTEKNTDSGATQIQTHAAANYIGQEVTACGPVAQTTAFKKGIYLNFDRPYPQHSLTVVIWDNMHTVVESKLGPLNALTGINVCATGPVEQYKKNPQIQIANTSAIRLQSQIPKQGVTSTQQIKPASLKSDSNVERIEAYRAPFYVGKQVMACGVLAAATKFAKGMYLSLDKKYPNQTLTLVLWDENLAPIEANFGALNSLIGRTFCALGAVEQYKKSLQIQIENPQFLRLMQG